MIQSPRSLVAMLHGIQLHMEDQPQESLEWAIQVRGRFADRIEKYPLTNWRRAFNAYLDEIWSQQNDSAEGVLIIGDIVLCFRHGEYSISSPAGVPVPERPVFSRNEIHAVSGERRDVELGLAKFVRNNSLNQFVIEFGSVRLMFWKGLRRTDLNFCVVDRTF